MTLLGWFSMMESTPKPSQRTGTTMWKKAKMNVEEEEDGGGGETKMTFIISIEVFPTLCLTLLSMFLCFLTITGTKTGA